MPDTTPDAPAPARTKTAPRPDIWSFTYARSNTVTRRSTYFLAGQAVAVRQVIPGVSNNLLHLHRDHLGSNSVMSYSSNGGMVAGSRTRYLPFGSYRTAPNQAYTDLGFTSQKHNDDVGLIYYNARYYIPGVGRFASADSIVPDAGNPQALNRFSYVGNRPLISTDPTGHCSRPGECIADIDGHFLVALMVTASTVYAMQQLGPNIDFDWEVVADWNRGISLAYLANCPGCFCPVCLSGAGTSW